LEGFSGVKVPGCIEIGRVRVGGKKSSVCDDKIFRVEGVEALRCEKAPNRSGAFVDN
jgi:hypothetical protein